MSNALDHRCPLCLRETPPGEPRVCVFPKADKLYETQELPNVVIRIEAALPDFSLTHAAMEEVQDFYQDFYQDQAAMLADALQAGLPQGLLHELLVHLLQRKVDIYRGRALVPAWPRGALVVEGRP